ncbi:MAG: Radical Pyruvate-formate lyase-activating enzyme like protein [Labilithrix sp.]|nr:Radical Pyruvate-formate lyase-activating enzyme like protein [Labilithrix sp.]
MTRAHRALPIAPVGRRHLPLAESSRSVDREVRPVNAIWELTLRCDLACHHCSSRAGRARPDELSTAEALEAVDQMADLGVLEVTLIGGEAYLHEGWGAVVRRIRERRMECTMVTGGRGITEERARIAKESGLSSVSVSIDGRAQTHDALRGAVGSHASAISAMAHLVAAGLQVSANTQIGRRNKRELEAIFDEISAAGAHSWQVQLTVAAGRVTDHPALLLEPYHLLEVMPSVARIKPRADQLDVRIWPGNNFGYYGPYESLLRAEWPLGRKGSCGAGRFIVGIEANGAVKACPSLPTQTYTGGNLRDDSLRDIWERAEPLQFTRNARGRELWGHCKGCYYAEDCLGGCSWTAHSLFGRRGNNPFCHHRALDLLRRGRRERLVLVSAGSGAPFEHGIFELVEEEWPSIELERARAIVAGAEEWLLEQ